MAWHLCFAITALEDAVLFPFADENRIMILQMLEELCSSHVQPASHKIAAVYIIGGPVTITQLSRQHAAPPDQVGCVGAVCQVKRSIDFIVRADINQRQYLLTTCLHLMNFCPKRHCDKAAACS